MPSTLILLFLFAHLCISAQNPPFSFQPGTTYNLSKLIMGTNKEDALQEEEEMRKTWPSQFPERKDFFKLYSYKEAKLKFKVLLEKNRSQIKESDTLIEMDCDMENWMKVNGTEVGIFHFNGLNKVTITKLEPLKGNRKIRNYTFTKTEGTKFILYDEDNPGLYAYYHFIVQKEKKKPKPN